MHEYTVRTEHDRSRFVDGQCVRNHALSNWLRWRASTTLTNDWVRCIHPPIMSNRQKDTLFFPFVAAAAKMCSPPTKCNEETTQAIQLQLWRICCGSDWWKSTTIETINHRYEKRKQSALRQHGPPKGGWSSFFLLLSPASPLALFWLLQRRCRLGTRAIAYAYYLARTQSL